MLVKKIDSREQRSYRVVLMGNPLALAHGVHLAVGEDGDPLLSVSGLMATEEVIYNGDEIHEGEHRFSESDDHYILVNDCKYQVRSPQSLSPRHQSVYDMGMQIRQKLITEFGCPVNLWFSWTTSGVMRFHLNDKQFSEAMPLVI